MFSFLVVDIVAV